MTEDEHVLGRSRIFTPEVINDIQVKALGIDCVPGEWTEDDTEFIERKFRIYDLGTPPEFQKFVCGKKLYNYDNLEPSERKLVL